jgi:hypothetical protein
VLKKTAEEGRFELPIALAHYDGLANRCLQPLGHPSKLPFEHLFCPKVAHLKRRLIWGRSLFLFIPSHQLNLSPIRHSYIAAFFIGEAFTILTTSWNEEHF